MNLHHSYAFMEPGEIVRAGNWGRVVRGYGGQHNIFFRETLWEFVREREFANLPSRLESAYFYKEEATARRGMLEGDPNRSPNLYEVQVLDASAPTHRADLHLWERAWWDVHSPSEAVDVARAYWNCDAPSGRFEWLTLSDLQVVKVVERSRPR